MSFLFPGRQPGESFEAWLSRQDFYVRMCLICETAHSRRQGCPPDEIIVKTCACGRRFKVAEWAALPKQEQVTGGEVLDLVECPACRSTLALPRLPSSK